MNLRMSKSSSTVMKKAKFAYPVVEVIWVDSEHDAEWNTLSKVLEDNSKTLECRSCGFLIADKEDRVVLATSIGMAQGEDEEQVSAYLTIPKQAILWIKGLPKKKEKVPIEAT